MELLNLPSFLFTTVEIGKLLPEKEENKVSNISWKQKNFTGETILLEMVNEEKIAGNN